MTAEFKEFPKMARLRRECLISEKIDGTNACLCLTEDGQFLTGSRTRWITPTDDNHGFSKWAHTHKDELLTLGPGTHFGEWWGSGIQKSYGLKNGEKRWSLFNAARWCPNDREPRRIITADPRIEKYQQRVPACCHVVPILFQGIFDSERVQESLDYLQEHGSLASPGFMRPEGVVCYHVAAGVGFKTTLDKDEEWKTKK